MKVLKRDEILAADDIVVEDVPVPEWDGSVRVRTLKGSDRARLMALVNAADEDDEKSLENWIEKVIVACACDENNEPLFRAEDVDRLRQKSAAALQRIFIAADDLNLLSDLARERTKGE